MKLKAINEVKCIQGAYETSDMFRLAKLILVILTMSMYLALTSCSKENVDQSPNSVENLPSIDPVSQKMKNYLISEYGFSENNIQETKYCFVVEGDIIFPKADFWQNYSQDTTISDGSKKHYRFINLVKGISTIPVNIGTDVPSGWKSAFISAINKWNSLNGKVSFKLVTGYCPAYGINIGFSSLGSNGIVAQGTIPTSNGYPGLFITINSKFIGSTNSSQKLYTAVHELGHNIGFAHTDISSGYMKIITSLTSCNTGSDPSSVMRTGNIPPFADFSTCDKASFKVLYPK